MAAILFGSIGTLVDTSELQRRAFNEAFTRSDLDWHWSQAEYRDLLKNSGGRQRVAAYARAGDRAVDAEAIHHLKSEIFQGLLQTARLEPRPGVIEVIREVKQQQLKLALVTTTSVQNIAALFTALSKDFNRADFDLVTDISHARQPKPYQDIYTLALEKLSERAASCVAIEDNLAGLEAAKRAGLACIAFPGENTNQHDFVRADLQVARLQFDELKHFYSGVLAE